MLEIADDLTNLWENFSLTENEDLELAIPRVELQARVTRGKACVLEKLVSDRIVSLETVKSTLLPWWKPNGSFLFKVLGDNLFLIDLTEQKDKERVLMGKPWVFEGYLFIVEDFDGITPPSQFSFDKAVFWVRMINLPLACMNVEIGQKIRASVGTMETVDADAEGNAWGKFLQVKILLDLKKPLPRGRKINIEGMANWIMFQYERLPKLCFQCRGNKPWQIRVFKMKRASPARHELVWPLA